MTKGRLSLSKNLYKRYVESPDVILNESKEKKLVSVKYKHLGVDWTNPDTLIARGLVITKRGKIVARPYDKFFNYHQFGQSNLLPAEVQYLTEWHSDLDYIMDKADGSLVIAYTYKGKQFMSSSGSVHSEHSDLFLKLLDSYGEETKAYLYELGKTHTILLEYVGPDNRIVLDYKKEEFILHGARNTKTGKYFSLEELSTLSKATGIKQIDIYEGISSLEDVLDNLSVLSEKEGFVAVFKDGYRLKFKTEEYLSLHHHMQSADSLKYVKGLINMFVDETLDDLMATLIKENAAQVEVFHKLFDYLHEMDLKLDEIQEHLLSLVKKGLSRKEVVNVIKGTGDEASMYLWFLSEAFSTGKKVSLIEIMKRKAKVRRYISEQFYKQLKEKEQEEE